MIWSYLVAFLCGASLTLAFAPFNIYTLAFILPAILLFLLIRATPKKALWLGWLFGTGLFSTGASWIYISIHAFGNTNVTLASIITFIFVVWMGSYFALLGYVFRKFFSRTSTIKQCLFVFPALWVAIEYLRSVLFTGFPWLLLGYTQLTTPLKAFAPIVGVYGLSLITALISGGLVLLSTHQTRKYKAIALVLIFGLTGLGFIGENHAWTKVAGDPIQTTLIQGDIPITTKWDRSFVVHNINVYKDLTLDNFSSKLIVWPEGAMPVYAQDATTFIHLLNLDAKKHHSNIIFGVPIKQDRSRAYVSGANDSESEKLNNLANNVSVDREATKYYNGLLLIGDNHGEYLKRHLVPFGEYIPLQSIFAKGMKYFNIPMSGFSEGPRKQPDLVVDHIRIAPFICYEITYPDEVLNAAEHSELLVTISDDSWFGRSVALAQHLQMAQMRSLETGRYQLVSTNSGITAFVSPFGKILKGAPIDQRVAITDSVYPMTGKTPLMMWRYYPVIAMIILMLLLALF